MSATSAGFPSSSPLRRRWTSASTNGSCRVTFRSRASSTAASTRLSRGPDRATSGWTSGCCGPNRYSPSPPPAEPKQPFLRAKLRVLVDADLTSWQAWNDFATEFAEATGARLVHIDDGGIAGTAFHDRALRLNAPVLMSPKRYFDRLPARLRTRPVVDPCPLWCWSLVTRADDDRESIAALREHAVNAHATGGLAHRSGRADLASLGGPAPRPHPLARLMRRSSSLLQARAGLRVLWRVRGKWLRS